MRLTAILPGLLLLATLAGPAFAHPQVLDTGSALAEAGAASAATAATATTAAETTVALAAAPPSGGLALGALGLALAALGVLARLPRRALVVALGVCLSVVAFEGALHSVHHLGELSQATCAVAAGVAQMHGTTPASALADVATPVPAERLLAIEPSLSVPALARPALGRAPPLA